MISGVSLFQAHSKATQTPKDMRVKGTQTKCTCQSRMVQTDDVLKIDQACGPSVSCEEPTPTDMEVDTESEDSDADLDGDPNWEMNESFSDEEFQDLDGDPDWEMKASVMKNFRI